MAALSGEVTINRGSRKGGRRNRAESCGTWRRQTPEHTKVGGATRTMGAERVLSSGLASLRPSGVPLAEQQRVRSKYPAVRLRAMMIHDCGLSNRDCQSLVRGRPGGACSVIPRIFETTQRIE
jgi:hypothetical protein